MTSRGQNTSSVESLVDRTSVAMVEHDFSLFARFEPQVWHRCEQLFRCWFLQHVDVRIPSATFKIQTINVSTISRSNFWILFVLLTENFKVEVQLINSNHILSSVVLLKTSQERLSKEETRDPEDLRSAVINPLLEEIKSFNEVYDVTSQRFEWRIRTFHPSSWNSVIENRVADSFEFGRHSDFSLNCFTNIYQRGSNNV